MTSSEDANGGSPQALRHGQRLETGVVRYVVRPVEWTWVGVMAVISLAVPSFVAHESGLAASAPVFLIFATLPLLTMWRSGFDVHLSRGTIAAWKGLGPLRFTSFELQRLRPPEVRSSMESRTGSDGSERRSRVTRLYWGNNHLRTTLKRGEVEALVAELREVIAKT